MTNQSPITNIDLLLASADSPSREIAELFRSGFESLGVAATLRCGELPDADPEQLSIVVAPHEYAADFLDGAVGRGDRADIASRVFALNTAAPGTAAFDRALDFAALSRRIFDVSERGVRAWRRCGLRAVHVPLGYAAILEALPDDADPDPSRPIDVVFLGHASERRGRFFAAHRDVFQALDCRVVIVPDDRPQPEDVTGPERNALLRSAKVVLNLQSSRHAAFDRHLALCAVANRACFLAETGGRFEPFVGGQDIVMAGLSSLAERCRRLIGDAEERTRFTERAYEKLQSTPIDAACRAILEHAAASPACPKNRGAVWRKWQRVKTGARTAATTARRVLDSSERPELAGELRDTASRWTASEKPFNLAFRASQLGRVATYRFARRDEFARMDQRRAEVLNRLNRQWEAEEPLFAINDNAALDPDSEPDVTVIIALYNYADTIIECLESVANSDLSELPGGIEVMVVNDASTDDSLELVKRWMEDATVPVRLIDKKFNTGLGEARNVGFALSRGPYVFVLDADNVIYPRCLAKLYGAIRGTRLAAVYGILAAFDEAGTGRGLISALPWDVSRLVAGPYIDAMAMFDRDRVLGAGGYTGDLVRYGWFGWEDYDLWLTLAKTGQEVSLHPEIVAGYRVHASSNTAASKLHTPSLAAFFRKKYASLVADVEPGPSLFGAPIPRESDEPEQAAA